MTKALSEFSPSLIRSASALEESLCTAHCSREYLKNNKGFTEADIDVYELAGIQCTHCEDYSLLN